MERVVKIRRVTNGYILEEVAFPFSNEPLGGDLVMKTLKEVIEFLKKKIFCL